MKTRNVVGVVPGSKHPDDYILYTAHWDHLGVKPDVAGPDKIYNGAVDNGMGVSSILEIGEKFAATSPPQRSIAIIAWTLEEQGLLGSQYFAEHPIWPLNHIVGGINLDANLPEGPAHDMVVVGNGASQLEDLLADRAEDAEPPHHARSRAGEGRLLSLRPHQPGQGRRADAGFRRRIRSRSRAAPRPARRCARTISSTTIISLRMSGDANWDLSGPIAGSRGSITRSATKLANSDAWPNWYKGNEFRAIRDKEMAAKN